MIDTQTGISLFILIACYILRLQFLTEGAQREDKLEKQITPQHRMMRQYIYISFWSFVTLFIQFSFQVVFCDDQQT